MLLAVALVLLIGYIFFDVNYFLRIFVIKLTRVVSKAEDVSVIYGFSLSLIDIAGMHMNNARFLRDLEFARINYLHSNGIYKRMEGLNGRPIQGDTNIRYRRPIPVLSVYKVVTKMVYCDSDALYLEHSFVTRDNFVRAVAVSKEILPSEALAALSLGSETKLTVPRDLELWMKSLETTSEKLRPHSA